MRKDHRPYYIKKIWFGFQNFYLRHFLVPHFDSFGKNSFVVKAWYIEVFGAPVKIGDNVTLLASSDKKTRLTVWSEKKGINGIDIGDHVLISPGVRISAASDIKIADNCMIASNAYITDSDWHGIYDRSLPPKEAFPVKLEENVWIGDSAIICKGVTIGKNSIIGAGAVVSTDIPANCIAVGNPAKIVREIDPEKEMITRKDRFSDSDSINMFLDSQERAILKGNTFWGWLRHLFFPSSSV
ncbi:MAG: acyltransferase [Thermodesulfobacteriota bacterium]|nr:acyltransferase [Thermodesulfobacteriota bacterium]